MGKIFDALEKSKQEQPFILSDKGPVHAKKEPAASGNLSIDSDRPVYDRRKMDANLITLFKPGSFESEQFKLLKTEILFPQSGTLPRTIMVTSAVPGEGKSFIAANLAISIAQNINQHVLLMDCDMRRPSLHRMFGFSDVWGLSDFLTNGTPLPSVLLKSPVEKLTLLPVGKLPANPAELLSSEKMSNLLTEVKTRYSDRYIIIDLPPPKLTAETSALARQVDNILLVVQYGSTRREMIIELIEMLGKEKILGVIFNRSNPPLAGYYGYKKYSKHYTDYKGHL